MKITLVDNLLLKRENESQQFVLQPHLGLISLIAVLENNGYAAELYDPKIDIAAGELQIDEQLYKNIAQKILGGAPDIVGFTSLGCNFICTLKIARYLKQSNPRLPILLGGPHATVLHTEILTAYQEFDVIVRNESEQKVVAVVEALYTNTLHTIEGITYREHGLVRSTPGASIINDLDALPFPAYHAYPIKGQDLAFIRVEAGRGCPFACTFCSTATFFGRSYRLKSAEKLCQELDYLHAQYGISDFGLTHDLFTVNKTKVIAFCKEVGKRKYTWRCSARMDCVDRELLTLMRDSGCTSIYYGIETGSQRMQKISKKKLDLEIFRETLDITLELGIAPTLSFIVGYPEENLADVQATLDCISSCMFHEKSDSLSLQLHLLTPEPGTDLHARYKDKLGFDDYISDFNFPTLEEDDAAIMESNPAVFMNHHYYEALLPRQFFVITASLFETLLALGNTITRYLLGNFENSLAKLNGDVYEWAKENSIKSITNHALVQYISHRFSNQHVLTSLLRYQFEATDLMHSGTAEDAENSKIYKRDNKPGFRLLKDIHNCPDIIRLLKAKRKLPGKVLTERHDFVIHVFQDKKSGKTLESYKLNEFAASIFKPIEQRVAARTDEFLADNH